MFDDGLLEVDLEPWSGMSIDELTERHPADFSTWKRQPLELNSNATASSYRPLVELMDQARSFVDGLIQRHPIDQNGTVLGSPRHPSLLVLTLLGEPERDSDDSEATTLRCRSSTCGLS